MWANCLFSDMELGAGRPVFLLATLTRDGQGKNSNPQALHPGLVCARPSQMAPGFRAQGTQVCLWKHGPEQG